MSDYKLDTNMRSYLGRLHAMGNEELETWSAYGSLDYRMVARDYAQDVCSRLFREEVIKPGKETRYILTTENLTPDDLQTLQNLANQTRIVVERQGEIFVIVNEADDPQGQQKLWAHFVLSGLNDNRLRQCYEIACRRLYVPDPIKQSMQETCGESCSKRRFMRSYLPGYRKRKKT